MEVPWAHATPAPTSGPPPPVAASMPGSVPSGPPSGGGAAPLAPPPGRMDLIITINGDDIPVDVSVASVLT
eukprot:1840031-Prorocentrum_lima.AAC.1